MNEVTQVTEPVAPTVTADLINSTEFPRAAKLEGEKVEFIQDEEPATEVKH